MNILLIGSCLDSSKLAKELNHKLEDSIVFRIDLLKNLKNLIPFSHKCSNNHGDYLGDVELIDFDKITDEEKIVVKAFDNSVKLIEDSNIMTRIMSINNYNIPSIERVTRNFDPLSLSLIRVVSGIRTLQSLTSYLGVNSSAVVVYINTPNSPLFERAITKKEFDSLAGTSMYKNHMFLSSENVDTLLKDEIFNLLIHPADSKKKLIVKPEAVEKEKEGYRVHVLNSGILRQVQDAPGLQSVNGTQNVLTLDILDNFVTTLTNAA